MSNVKHLTEAPKAKRRHDWFNLGVAGVARVLLLVAASMLLWALIPGLLGWHVTTTMSGSMEPRVMTGDVVVSMPYDGNKVITGQVILAPDPARPDHLRFHRVLKPGDNGTVITKGDNNPQADSDPIKRKDIVGVGVLRIPGLGLPALWMNQHQWIPLGVALIGLPFLLFLSSRDRYLREQLESARREEAIAQGKDPDPIFVRLLKRVTPKKFHGFGAQAKAITSIALVLVLIGGAVTLRGSESGFSSIDENPGNVTGTPDVWDCWKQSTSAGFYYGFNDSSTSVTSATNTGSLAGGDAIITGSANTKTASNCSSTTGSPFLNLDGSATSRLYSNTANSYTTRSNGVSVAFKVTSANKRNALIAAYSDTSGNNTAANTWAGIYLESDGTLMYSIAFENTSSAMTCINYNGSANTADGAWHYASVYRTANANVQALSYYLDGTLLYTNSSANATGQALKMKEGSTKTVTGYVRAGYSQGTSGVCSDSTHTARYAGAIDEISAPSYQSNQPGLH